MDAREQLGGILRDMKKGLSLDANGECAIETDDGDELLIAIDDESAQAVLSVMVAKVGDDGREKILEEALAINDDLALSGPARICYSRGNDMLAMRYATEIEGLESAGLTGMMAALLDLAAHVRRHLRSGDSLASGGDVDSDALSGYEIPLGSIRA